MLLKRTSPAESDKAARLFRSLRLIPGEDEVSAHCLSACQEYLNSRDADRSHLASSLPFHGDNLQFVWTAVLQSLCTDKDDAGIGGEFSFATYVGQCVKTFINSVEEEKDISFPDFCQFVPLCRYLTQVHRVEAWLRYLRETVNRTRPASSEGSPEAAPPAWMPSRLHALDQSLNNEYFNASRNTDVPVRCRGRHGGWRAI